MKRRIALYTLASLLMAAHFLRAGDLSLVALCLAAPLLFLVHRRWAAIVLQALSYAACLIWLATAWHIAAERQAFGEPWTRSAVILLSVAAVTALAGGILRGRSARQWFLRAA